MNIFIFPSRVKVRVEAGGAGREGDVRRVRLDSVQPPLGVLQVRLRRLRGLLQASYLLDLARHSNPMHLMI